MKMLTAADIEAAGPRLVLGKGDRLTPLARDRAKELGIDLVSDDASIAQQLVTRRPGVVERAAPASGKAFTLPPSGAMYRRNALGPAMDPSMFSSPGLHNSKLASNSKRPKTAVVGAGHVGAQAALRLAESDLFASVALIDVVPGLAAGLALDMWHGAGLYGFSTTLTGSDDLAALSGAQYIIVTAGKPRQPGMSRTDLTAVNAAIIESVSKGIRTHAPDSTVVIVSNPLEEMTYLAARFTGFPDERVIGMAGVLDSARFCSLVGLTGSARPQDVRALALGSHGPEMVVPLSQAFIGDKPIETVLDADTLKAITERTRESGGEVVKLLQKGSAYFSPAESAVGMLRAMVRNNGEVLAACVRSRGAYGVADTRVGLPVRLGPRGVLEIVNLSLRPQEQLALREAASRIAARIGELPK
jgi:malate dehydrogenase